MTFDLTLLFDEVIGMDSSAETIKKANNLKEGGEITYNVHIEGDISKECMGRVNPDIVSTHYRMDVTSAGQEIYLFIIHY